MCLFSEKMREKLWVYRKELKKVSFIAAPLAASTVLQYGMQIVGVMMVGHLGDELLLSGLSIASSFINVTGCSVLVSPFLSFNTFLISFPTFSLMQSFYTIHIFQLDHNSICFYKNFCLCRWIHVHRAFDLPAHLSINKNTTRG